MKEFNTVTGVSLNELSTLTNEDGKRFLPFLGSVSILGTTERAARTDEFFVIYQRGSYYGVACLPKASAAHAGACFFGDALHYSKVLQEYQPINAGKRHPFLFDVKTERDTEKWLTTTFGIPAMAFH